jgi:hypothetical protein
MQTARLLKNWFAVSVPNQQLVSRLHGLFTDPINTVHSAKIREIAISPSASSYVLSGSTSYPYFFSSALKLTRLMRLCSLNIVQASTRLWW